MFTTECATPAFNVWPADGPAWETARWYRLDELVRPLPPLWVVQLGWLVTAWIAWRAWRDR